MPMPLHGCCTDSPGLDDIATARAVYSTLAWFFAAAALAVLGFNTLLH